MTGRSERLSLGIAGGGQGIIRVMNARRFRASLCVLRLLSPAGSSLDLSATSEVIVAMKNGDGLTGEPEKGQKWHCLTVWSNKAFCRVVHDDNWKCACVIRAEVPQWNRRVMLAGGATMMASKSTDGRILGSTNRRSLRSMLPNGYTSDWRLQQPHAGGRDLRP